MGKPNFLYLHISSRKAIGTIYNDSLPPPWQRQRTDAKRCWYSASNPLPSLQPPPWHTPWQQRQVLTINPIRCIPNCHCQGVNTNHYPVIATPNMTYHTCCKAFPHASVFWEAHQQADRGIIELLLRGIPPTFTQKEKKKCFFWKKMQKHFANSKKGYTFASQLRNRCTLSSVGRAIDS